MSSTDTIIDELRDLAVRYPHAREALVEMAHRLQSCRPDDHASKHRAVGLLACDCCHGPCGTCVLDGWITMRDS